MAILQRAVNKRDAGVLAHDTGSRNEAERRADCQKLSNQAPDVGHRLAAQTVGGRSSTAHAVGPAGLPSVQVAVNKPASRRPSASVTASGRGGGRQQTASGGRRTGGGRRGRR